MPLSSYDIGNRFLDKDKLEFADDASYLPDVTSADRLIRAALLEIFGSVVNSWDINPQSGETSTPPIVQDISGMLAASYLYRRIYSEETTAQPLYADILANRAMTLIDGLRSGTLSLGDDAETVSETQFGEMDFWPNNTTVDCYGDPLRLFSISDTY